MRLVSILDVIRAGDVLIVVRLDPLGKNTRDVPNLIHELEEKDASFRMLEPAIDTGGRMGRMVLTILGHGCGDGARLHPRSSTRRHRRRKAKGIGTPWHAGTVPEEMR
jgi:hypothetical protein